MDWEKSDFLRMCICSVCDVSLILKVRMKERDRRGKWENMGGRGTFAYRLLFQTHLLNEFYAYTETNHLQYTKPQKF